MATLQVAKGQTIRNESVSPVFRPARSVMLLDAGIGIVTEDSGPLAPGVQEVIRAQSIAVAVANGMLEIRLPVVYGQQMAGSSSYTGTALIHWL
jgi:hypothetical protein